MSSFSMPRNANISVILLAVGTALYGEDFDVLVVWVRKGNVPHFILHRILNVLTNGDKWNALLAQLHSLSFQQRKLGMQAVSQN